MQIANHASDNHFANNFLFTIKRNEMKNNSGIAIDKVVSMVSQLVNYYPDPDNPQPPGPWDPVIRRAYERTALRMSTHSKLNSWDLVALNPQPLPPRAIFSQLLAQEVIERTLLMQEIADAINTDGQERGIIIVGGVTERFVDDLCPDRPKIPFPKKGPWPPEPDPDPRWQALELLVIGNQFQEAARSAGSESLKNTFKKAAEKIIATGISRM
jgi:hypothetical protein